MITDEHAMESQRLPVRLICYPHDDERLIERAREIVDEWGRSGTVAVPEQVAARLRSWYPNVAISVRQPLADLWGSQDPTWYVYRDGSILPDPRVDATSA